MSKSRMLTSVSSELIVTDTRTKEMLEKSLLNLKIQKAHNTSHTGWSSTFSFDRIPFKLWTEETDSRKDEIIWMIN